MLITYLRAHPATPIAHTLMEGMRSQIKPGNPAIRRNTVFRVGMGYRHCCSVTPSYRSP